MARQLEICTTFFVLVAIALAPHESFAANPGVVNNTRNLNTAMGKSILENAKKFKEEKKKCEYLQDQLKKHPTAKAQIEPKIKEVCEEKKPEAAKQTASNGKGLLDGLTALAQMMPKGQQNPAAASLGEALSDPNAFQAAIAEGSNLSPGQARRVVSALKEIQNSDSESFKQGEQSSSDSTGGGYSAAGAGGGGSLKVDSNADPSQSADGSSEKVNPYGDLASLGAGSSSGGGGGGSYGSLAPPLEEFQLDPLPEFNIDKALAEGSEELGSLEIGEYTNHADDKIGITSDDIWKKLSERYQYHKMANGFIEDEL